jgi:Domain of unknown function (DUF4349)
VKSHARLVDWRRSIVGIYLINGENMKKAKIFIVLFLIFLSSCALTGQESGRNASISQNEAISERSADKQNVSTAPNAPNAQVSLEQTANSQTPPTVTERKIIRNADLQLEANAPEETQQKIAAIAESKGGFVIESTQSSSDVKVTTRDVVSMTVRVPTEKFGEALGEIRQSGNRVIIETVKGQDVTEEFVDIEARLKAKRALEEQFIEIMKRSNSVADALNVQRELSNVRGEIEQIEGRKRFLENQTSLSTIKIRIQPPTAFSASSSGFFYQLQQAISSGFSFALNFILVLITLFIGILPFLIFIVLPVYLLIRYLLRRNQKRKLASEIAKEEIGEQ